ncbi:MAG: hypothetical protein WCK57_10440, partial [Verrucomicrobiae bacterium]
PPSQSSFDNELRQTLQFFAVFHKIRTFQVETTVVSPKLAQISDKRASRHADLPQSAQAKRRAAVICPRQVKPSLARR